MDVMKNIEDAAKLLNETAWHLREAGVLELDFQITIKAQRPVVELGFIGARVATDPGENLPPSK